MTTGGDEIDTGGGDDIIADLLSVPFSRWPFNEKMDIVKKGRQMPEHLELYRPAKVDDVRHFQAAGNDTLALQARWVELILYCWFCWSCISLNWLLFVSTHLLNDCS